jgi:hypothetical protein
MAKLPGGGDAQSITAIAGASLTFGPYAETERFEIICTTGTLTYATAAFDPATLATDVEVAAVVAALLTGTLSGTDTTHAPTNKAAYDALALKAPLANPAFTGNVTAEKISPTLLCLAEKTPVNAVAASKVLTFTGNAEDGETVSIGGQSYKFQGESAQAANDVLIGLNAEASIDNLVAAINGDDGEGTTYGTGTVAHESVTAAKEDTDKLVVTAKTKGESGNSIAIAKTVANATWADDATALSGGIDGTVGVANETCADGSYLYHCIATNTVADANWRKITLGTAF